MDEEKKGGNGIVSLPTLLLALALAGGSLLWKNPPLISPRPNGEMSSAAASERGQKIEARLWQDPLGAIERARKTAKPKTADPTAKLESIDSFALNSQQFSALIKAKADIKSRTNGIHALLVMVPDSMYAEEVETRLRIREALMSAFSHAGYRAEDEEHIGAVQLTLIKQDALNSAKQDVTDNTPQEEKPVLQGKPLVNLPVSQDRISQVTVPFEFFEHRANSNSDPWLKDHALVLWLPASHFEKQPLAQLAQLVGVLKSKEPEDSPSESKDSTLATKNPTLSTKSNISKEFFKFDVLGPVGSTILREMIPWHERLPMITGTETTPLALSGVRMFSWDATAQDELLVHDTQSYSPRADIKAFLKKKWGLDFINTTATDDQLCSELADELQLRNVDLTDRSQHIALIFEWDSFYGRTLPVSFTAEAFRRQQHWSPTPRKIRRSVEAVLETQPNRSPNAICGAVSNIHAFTYLRGIDGKLLKEEVSEAPQRTKSTTTSMQERSNAQEAMNRAEGQNQFDYVPRVALQLSELDRRLKIGEVDGPDQRGKLSAIGVVGGDFYDKLLILQELRAHFPDVVFFTTDLDARFLDPEFERWARNLVVASNFGLTLHPEIQREAPAFRGNYQTAFFFAALSALHQVREKQFIRVPAPRRFEIGRINPVDLSTRYDPGKTQPFPSREHPSYAKLAPSIGLLFSGMLLLFNLVPSLRRRFNFHERESSRQTALSFTEQQILDPISVLLSLPEYMAAKQVPRPKSVLPLRLIEKVNQFREIAKCRMSASELNEIARYCACWLNNYIHLDFSQSTAASCLPWRNYLRLKSRTKVMGKRHGELETYFVGKIASGQSSCRVVALQLDRVYLGFIIALSAFIAFFSCVCESHSTPEGEPFSLFEGVSAWPCEILRFVALILSCLFFFKAWADIQSNENEISTDFFLRDFHKYYALAYWWRIFRPKARKESVLTSVLNTPYRLVEFSRQIQVIGWSWRPMENASALLLWKNYQQRSALLPRIVRTSIRFAIYMFFLICISSFGDQPYAPVRGPLAIWIDKRLLIWVVTFSIFLNLFVADAARLARTFIKLLSRAPTKWPEKTCRLAVTMNGKDDFESMDEWLDIRFIEKLTETTAKLVYYPFIVLGLLIVARIDYFDSWSWPTMLVIVFILNSLWAVHSAFLMQSAASDAREIALESLRRKKAAAGSDVKLDRSKLLDEAYESIKATTQGAFAGYLNNPALKALLLPFTGAGLVNLINFLTNK